MNSKEIKKIVLTGGPGGGKTTVLPICTERLLSAGYEVINVAEAATTVMNSGIKVNNGVVSVLEFQRFLLKYQLFWENAIKSIKFKSDRPLVILLDRSIIDSKAYINDEEWKKLLIEFALSESEVFQRYDSVIHLVTAAYGAENAYTCENNNQRGEKSIEEARRVEDKVKAAYYGHLNVRYIDNSTNFDGKIQRVIDTIFQNLDLAIPKLEQRKFLVDKDEFIKQVKLYKPQCRFIKQTYLLSSDSNIERRVREIGIPGEEVYYYTIKYKDNTVGIKEIPITYDMYKLLLREADNSHAIIDKQRWYFSKDNIYYTLDVFENPSKLAILEARVTSRNEVIEFPGYGGIFKEVTLNNMYSNYNISKKN